jgi:hypothetical protein
MKLLSIQGDANRLREKESDSIRISLERVARIRQSSFQVMLLRYDPAASSVFGVVGVAAGPAAMSPIPLKALDGEERLTACPGLAI